MMGLRDCLNCMKVGVKCLCENEADSIVYGMPKKAKDINPKLRPMSLKEIKQEILNFINEE